MPYKNTVVTPNGTVETRVSPRHYGVAVVAVVHEGTRAALVQGAQRMVEEDRAVVDTLGPVTEEMRLRAEQNKARREAIEARQDEIERTEGITQEHRDLRDELYRDGRFRGLPSLFQDEVQKRADAARKLAQAERILARAETKELVDLVLAYSRDEATARKSLQTHRCPGYRIEVVETRVEETKPRAKREKKVGHLTPAMKTVLQALQETRDEVSDRTWERPGTSFLQRPDVAKYKWQTIAKALILLGKQGLVETRQVRIDTGRRFAGKPCYTTMMLYRAPGVEKQVEGEELPHPQVW